MLKATLRGFLAHKGRLFLSLLAVVLSVAFVTGTLLFTGTISNTFDRLFRNTSADVSVSPHSTQSVNQPDLSGSVPTESDSLVAKVAAVPGVASAYGAVEVSGVVLVNSRNQDIGSVSGAPFIS